MFFIYIPYSNIYSNRIVIRQLLQILLVTPSSHSYYYLTEEMELILVSGTRSLIDTCLVDLHIQLDRFPHLPRPFSVNPWNKTKMSPLRDR